MASRTFNIPKSKGTPKAIKIANATDVAARYFVYKLYEATDGRPEVWGTLRGMCQTYTAMPRPPSMSISSPKRPSTSGHRRVIVRANPRQRRHIAIHEAGHAVMAMRLGLKVVSVRPWWGGRMSGDCHVKEKPVRDAADARAAVLVTLAGWAACSVHRFRNAEAGCVADFAKARRLIRVWKLGDLAALRREARDTLRRPENVRAVATIAGALVEQDCRIEGRYLHEVLAVADRIVGQDRIKSLWLRAILPATRRCGAGATCAIVR